MTIRIRKHIDSETLHLPELRALVGKDVEITVVADDAAPENNSAPKPIWQDFGKILAGIDRDDLARLPRDGAEQHDHYIHRTARKCAFLAIKNAKRR